MKLDEHYDHFTVPEDYAGAEREARQEEADDREKHPCRPRRRGRRILIWSAVILLAALGTAFYLRYVNPYVTDATEHGYIADMERRGIVFKTWEGKLIRPDRAKGQAYYVPDDFTFSVTDTILARTIMQYKNTGTEVEVDYQRYFGMLPWRGSATIVVTAIRPTAPQPSDSIPAQ